MSGSGREQASSAIWVAVGQIELPEKKYFKIGEVAHLVGVEPHVLRYWQTQFPQVRPHKSRSGHRLYRRKDVETLLAVKELLHVQRFTIAGARQALKNAVVHRGDTTVPPVEIADTDLPRYAAETSETAFDDDVEAASIDAELDLAPAEAEAPAVEVEEIEVVGLPADELQDALEDELAARHAATEQVEVRVAPAAAPPPATSPIAAPPTGAPISAAPTPAAPTPAAPTPAAPTPAAPTPAAAMPAAPPSPVTSRAMVHRGRDVAGRMEFGLVATTAAGREALLDARRELMALIGVLDREDGERRRASSSNRY